MSQSNIEHMVGLLFPWEAMSLVENMNKCLQTDHEAPHLPIFYIWNLWLAHNRIIFKDLLLGFESVCHCIMEHVNSYPVINSNLP